MQEVLRQVALIQPGLFNHLTLRDRVLIHVFLDGLSHHTLVTTEREGVREWGRGEGEGKRGERKEDGRRGLGEGGGEGGGGGRGGGGGGEWVRRKGG